nr:type I pullulanase [uncultured Ruminococcus sp.]
MRTTKKIVSAVLAACMLASTAVVSSFAATADDSSAVSSDYARDNSYTKAAEDIDAQYAYSGDDLGVTYTKDATTFKVWSPTATGVKLNIFTTGSDDERGASKVASYTLEKMLVEGEWNGVWTITLVGNWKDYYYTYSVTTTDTTHIGSDATKTYETQDVYSTATGVNGKRSMIVDLDETDPDGWSSDNHVLLDKSTQSSVWELHIKDFSYDKASGVSEANRGKYLAFTENGTTLNGEGKVSTCIDYLKELGVTTVQLNPFYDFQSVNEAGADTQFNWGYDPQNYNVPEGSYSSNPYNGKVRIKECKEMIKALHDAGISVVMDVVYNHTFSTDSCFQHTVPNYYYRMKTSGAFSDGSGCGNEGATERAMYRQYVIDSLKYWVNEYHIDGFRFDLMGIMDVETMNMAREALDQIDPRITMWGEGWAGGDSYHPTNTCSGTKFYPATQANAARLSDRIAIFNDGIRDGVKGSAMGINNTGFVQGSKTSAKDVNYGIRANSSGTNKWKAQAPSQCVTYDSCHDNATLYDQILASTGLASFGERNSEAVKMNKLASAIIYTSQGISFTLAGEEMARSKDGDTNSYKSDPELNMIKWQNVVDYADVVSYYKGMMQIKSAFSPLTAMDTSYANNFIFTNKVSSPTNQISYTLANDVEGEWNKIAVLYNNASTAADVTLADTSVTDWVIIANGETAGLDSLGEVTGSTFTVPARSAIVAVDKAGYESAGIHSSNGKVKVNYVYESTGEKLEDSVVLQGPVGSGYVTVPSAGVPDTYIVSRVEGNTEGKYTDGTQEVTYMYTDYIPETIKNADFNGDGEVDVIDATLLQKYILKLETPTVDQSALDLNYDDNVSVEDTTMLMKSIVNLPVSSGKVTVNYYYTDAKGQQKKLTDSIVFSGRAGSTYESKAFKVVGYSVDPDNMPAKPAGYIPYGEAEVNYYYIASSLDITLHVKHNGSLTWTPYLWIWGSNLKGADSGNFMTEWPGDPMTKGENGWFDYSFTYKGAGTYNVIVSDNATNQTIDYKGFVDNEMWIVIDDSAVMGGTYLTFYTDNPDTNPNAPIAEQVTLG